MEKVKLSYNKNFDTISLSYSCFNFMSGNHYWFCRILHKDWKNRISTERRPYGEAYGRNKFEAYRNAIKNLNSVRDLYCREYSIKLIHYNHG